MVARAHCSSNMYSSVANMGAGGSTKRELVASGMPASTSKRRGEPSM